MCYFKIWSGKKNNKKWGRLETKRLHLYSTTESVSAYLELKIMVQLHQIPGLQDLATGMRRSDLKIAQPPCIPWLQGYRPMQVPARGTLSEAVKHL